MHITVDQITLDACSHCVIAKSYYTYLSPQLALLYVENFPHPLCWLLEISRPLLLGTASLFCKDTRTACSSPTMSSYPLITVSMAPKLPSLRHPPNPNIALCEPRQYSSLCAWLMSLKQWVHPSKLLQMRGPAVEGCTVPHSVCAPHFHPPSADRCRLFPFLGHWEEC